MVEINWSVILYVSTALVIVIAGVLVWYFLIQDKETEPPVADAVITTGDFDGTLDTSNLYRFLEKQYVIPNVNLGAFNACSTDNNPVQCEDEICSNCICPDKCRERGTKYMIMDQLSFDENKYRCMCFNRLRDVITDDSAIPRDDVLISNKPSSEGSDWRIMDRWFFRLLPPPGQNSSDDIRLYYGSGGQYLEDDPLYPFNARYKVYATYADTSEAGIGAVYMLDSVYDDDAMSKRFVDEF